MNKVSKYGEPIKVVRSMLKDKDLPYKPQQRLKPAFTSPTRDRNQKKPVLRELNFDLAEIFADKGKSGECYKSLAKWDMPYDREQIMHEMIDKRAIPDLHEDPSECRASREYLWSRMTDAVFQEDM